METQYSILFEWSKDGNIDAIKNYFNNTYPNLGELETQVKEVNIIDSHGRNILHWACFYGQIQILRWMLDNLNLNLEVKDWEGYNALDCVVVRGYKESLCWKTQFLMVQKLLKKGARFNDSYKNTNNPLHWACYYGNHQLILSLLDLNQEFLKMQNEDKHYPIDLLFLQEKSQKYSIKNIEIFLSIIKLYKDYQKELLEQNENGQKSKMFNQFYMQKSKWVPSKEPIVQLIYATKPTKKVDFEIPQRKTIIFSRRKKLYEEQDEEQSEKPLLSQQKHRTKEFIQLSSYRHKSSYTGSPGPRKQAMQFKIFDSQFNIWHTENKLELRLMYWAAYINQPEVLIYFLNRHCSPFSISFRGYNALHIAASRGNIDIVKIIAESEYTLKKGQNKINKSQLIKSHFNKKIAINIMTTFLPSSPLHLAIEQDHHRCAFILINAGCSNNLLNYRNLKPLQLKSNESYDKLKKKFKLNQANNLNQQGFCYVIKTKGLQKIQDDIARIQLVNLHMNLLEQGINFEFLTLFSQDYDERNNKINFYYHVLKLSHDSIYKLADIHELKMYHLIKRIITKFQYKEQNQFEFPKDLLLQGLIDRCFDSEFNMDIFMMEGLVLDHFPLDDPQTTVEIEQIWKKNIFNLLKNSLYPVADQLAIQPVNSIAFHYGPTVGWYFAFMVHLTSWLSIPSIVGIALGSYMLITYDFNSKLVPIYAILLAIWSTLFIESWKRRENELSFIWDMHDYQSNEPQRAKYRGAFTLSNIDKKIIEFDTFTTFKRKLVVEIPTILFGVLLAISSFLIFNYISNTEFVKGNSIIYIIVASLNAVVMTILSELYKLICYKVVEWENHMFESEAEFSYILKFFIFEFINSYITLIYQATVEQNAQKLAISVAGIVITRGIIQNKSNIVPYMLNGIVIKNFQISFSKFKKRLVDKKVSNREDTVTLSNNKRNKKKQNENLDGSFAVQYTPKSPQLSHIRIRSEYPPYDDQGNSFQPLHINLIPISEGAYDQNSVADQEYMQKQLSIQDQVELLEQVETCSIKQPQKDLIDEYTNLAIQFGYITMFATAFPGAPIVFMLNLYLNLQFSMYNYKNVMKRETSKAAPGLGIWVNIFSIMNYAATFMNCILIGTVNKNQINNLIGEGSYLRNVVILVLVEHIIIILKFLIAFLIDDVPEWITAEKKRREIVIQKSKSNQEQLLKSFISKTLSFS